MGLISVCFGLLVLAPLIGFVTNGIRFRRTDIQWASIIGVSAISISFLAASILFWKMLGAENRVLSLTVYEWFSIGSFKIDFGLLMDPISGMMTLVITGVGLLIHVFSIGYMAHDNRPAKYFAYLNLFIFNMLLLVLGDNLLVTFVGWEGVGLCSYLLIGFWFTDEQKAAAGMKAFVTNRIGDAGLLIGIFFLVSLFGTTNYYQINQYAGAMDIDWMWTGPITLAMPFLFLGVTGKSAQLPLYVWLPDAMAGPTPVSALIHAATMVTAGVYLLIRLSPVLVLAPHAMTVVATIGALTALLGALIGITQWDIKKILAYSTVSQLGYMILGVGVGAFIPAFFHLLTHAFFKALMFLGSGSVIHAMHEEQDIRKMGGLAKWMPITHLTFVIGWLAIIGLPPFSGFFSKDEILFYSLASSKGAFLYWVIGFVSAGFTAFYMTRLMCYTFWGESRRDDSKTKPHESSLSMTIPLIILSLFAALAGLLGIPHIIGALLPGHPSHLLSELLSAYIAKVDLRYESHLLEWILIVLSVAVAIIGVSLAYVFYIKKSISIDTVKEKIRPLYDLSFHKFYMDEIYSEKIIKPFVEIAEALWTYIDVMLIDRITYLASDIMKQGGKYNERLQDGRFQTYAFFMVLGLGVICLILFM